MYRVQRFSVDEDYEQCRKIVRAWPAGSSSGEEKKVETNLSANTLCKWIFLKFKGPTNIK